MTNRPAKPLVCIAGTPDFLRRFASKRDAIAVNLTDARSAVFSERPDIFFVDIGLRLTERDLDWLKELLAQVRQRFQQTVRIVLAITTPERLLAAGELLFADSSTLTPSGLVDDFILAPPQGVPGALTLEEQFESACEFALEAHGLPTLNDEAWAPSFADPESRSTWIRWIPRYARYVNESPVLVGPSGAGKTRMAAAIHKLSGREGPFVTITPRDFSSSELIQAELFGAVAGAYTGAVEKWGLVKRAEKGTLFIDELQSIDLELQGKLITFIENKSYRRVGEAESHQADVRFVFATNRPLAELVGSGKLRDDFAYRLERLQVNIKPLAERRLDIGAGVAYALSKIRRERKAHRSIEGLTNEAYRRIFLGTWPGNLRQLENGVSRLIEAADIDHVSRIDERHAGLAMQNLLGEERVSAERIFERALTRAMKRVSECGSFDALSLLVHEESFTVAIESAGGDLEEAARLLGEDAATLALFVSARSAPARNSEGA